MRPTMPPNALPNPFFNTQQDRVALARERYFEQGERPSGLVSEPVIQSWNRCLGARRSPDEKIGFDPISKIRIATVLTKNRALIEVATDPIAELETAIAGSQARVLLTSSEGVVVMASRSTAGDGPLLRSAARVGVSIGEASVGTGAPGVAVNTGEVCIVRGGEHFFRCLEALHCAAAPVRDASGRTVAMLDLTSEIGPFRFDAGALAHMYATCIENRLLANAARSQLMLRFQSSKTMFHTPLEGLAAVDEHGQVRWFNGVGARLFDCPRVPEAGLEAEAVFGLDLRALLALAHDGRAQLQMLPSGLTLWMAAQLDERAGQPAGPLTTEPVTVTVEMLTGVDALPAVGGVAASPLSSPSLDEANRRLIEQTLAQCQGNVSRAARRLGVSRGLLYRRLREWGAG